MCGESQATIVIHTAIVQTYGPGKAEYIREASRVEKLCNNNEAHKLFGIKMPKGGKNKWYKYCPIADGFALIASHDFFFLEIYIAELVP